MNSLELLNISKSFGNFLALENISFRVNGEEFVSIIGPSGCGKSTLLRIIAGVDDTSSGDILMSGKTVADRRGMSGYMPQKPLLLPWRNVLANVVLGADIKNSPRTESLQKARK